MTDTSARVVEIRERCERTTPRPWLLKGEHNWWWVTHPNGDWSMWKSGGYRIAQSHDGNPKATEDFAFIAHAREDIPFLLSEVKRLEAENKRLRGLVERSRDYVATAGCATDWARDDLLTEIHEALAEHGNG